MTPTTLALVERLANDASSGNGAMLIGIDEVARFFALAMEHATDPRARKIATEALLSAPSQPAAQQERKPLTDEQIDRVLDALPDGCCDEITGAEARSFARAIEAELRKLWGISPAGADTKGEQT